MKRPLIKHKIMEDWKGINTDGWMIRSDGRRLPVLYHLYIVPGQKYENVAGMMFLYDTTFDSTTQDTVLSVFKTWAEEDFGPDFTLEEMKEIFGGLCFIDPDDFYEKHFEEIKAAKTVDTDTALESLGRTMDNLFMRARYESRDKLLSFRISSQGVKWGKVIEKTIMDLWDKMDLQYITVVKETGRGKEKPYNVPKSQLYKQTIAMPINDFLEYAPREFESDNYLLHHKMSSPMMEDIRRRLVAGQSIPKIIKETHIYPLRLFSIMDCWILEQRDFTKNLLKEERKRR